MNYNFLQKQETSLLDLVAEKLLDDGYAISYQKMNNMEFISATLHRAPEGKRYFMAFDPVKTNAAVFLTMIRIFKGGNKRYLGIVVPAEGERNILLNILTMQEMDEIEIFSLNEFSSHPYQVLK